MSWRFRRHKYNAKRVEYDGIKFASMAERDRYIILRQMEGAGLIKNLRLQPKFLFPMGYSYIPDFEYEQDGRLVVEDVKGFETAEFKLKAKCFMHFFPAYKFYLVKNTRVKEYKSKGAKCTPSK